MSKDYKHSLTLANTGPLDAVNLTSSEFKANPFPYYARLRAEAPVFATISPVTKQRTWLVTRYDDAVAVLKDDRRFVKDSKNAMTPEQWKKPPKMPAMFNSISHGLLTIDGADHTRLRALVHKAFTPRLIEQWHDQIETVTSELLDAGEQKGRMDLVADFALPLPITIISRILGIPEKDSGKFQRWVRVIFSTGVNPNPLVMVPAVLRLMSYIRKLIKARMNRPQDDLISALVQAKEGSSQMTENELLSMVFLLLSAGYETTVNLLGSGTLALLENPEQFARFRDNPEPALVKSGIEELLRFVTPAEMATERYATEDVTIAGTTIPRGEQVMVVIASANRDRAYFESPDALDLRRENNKHLSFGQGIHYCLGAPLSRLEGQIALPMLARRMPDLRLAVPPEQVKWRGTFILRGLETLPVTF